MELIPLLGKLSFEEIRCLEESTWNLDLYFLSTSLAECYLFPSSKLKLLLVHFFLWSDNQTLRLGRQNKDALSSIPKMYTSLRFSLSSL